jgi:hypothetical protein
VEGRLEGDVHVVVASEGLAAVGTLSGARLLTFVDAFSAEDVTAGFDRRVLESAATDCADCECLYWLALISKLHRMTYP